jgi:PadR family transcriptional regulator, regulatory protein PadR
MNPNLLKGNLELILLAILEHEAMYGLEIIKEAEARTEGYFQFKEGSLYPALHRLVEQKLLRAEFGYPPRGGAKVRYYSLSEQGKHELATRRAEFKRFNSAVEALGGQNNLGGLL